MARKDNLIIKDASLMFKNFEGAEKQRNRAGNRNFCVVIDSPELFNQLLNDGWNVKTYTPKEPDSPNRYRPSDIEPINYLPVTVRYDGFQPPKVTIVTKYPRFTCDQCDTDINPGCDVCPTCGHPIKPIIKQRALDEDTVGELDNLDLELIDIDITPYNWEFNGKHGIKAYLKKLYAVVAADPLDLEWAQMISDSEIY